MPIGKPENPPATVDRDALRDMVRQGASERTAGAKLMDIAVGVGGVLLLAHLLDAATGKKPRFHAEKLENTAAFGAVIRQRRQDMGLTQEQLAVKSGVGPRFIVDAEKGKPTSELAKLLQVLDALNLQLSVSVRS